MSAPEETEESPARTFWSGRKLLIYFSYFCVALILIVFFFQGIVRARKRHQGITISGDLRLRETETAGYMAGYRLGARVASKSTGKLETEELNALLERGALRIQAASGRAKGAKEVYLDSARRGYADGALSRPTPAWLGNSN
jgi:hypothetical protein